MLALPTYFKTKSKLIVITSALASGMFFGLLMIVSSFMGQLEGPEGRRGVDLRLRVRDECGRISQDTLPVWMSPWAMQLPSSATLDNKAEESN